MASEKNEKHLQTVVKDQEDQLNRYKKRLQGFKISTLSFSAAFLPNANDFFSFRCGCRP